MATNNKWGWNYKNQSILPLVFDDSISYYEAISRLIYTVNQLVLLINNSIDENLKSYIDSKFDSLMINAIYDEETETIVLRKETL
nr:MAG TPA: hypothetical protein [Caudoviricetes sp.]